MKTKRKKITTCRELPDLDEAQTFKHHEGT